MAHENAITIRGLTAAYDSKPVLWNVNLSIPKGGLIAVAGPNGAGKSTLLKILMRQIKPLAGSVAWFTPHPRIGYVPQRDSIDWDFPATVLDAVLMGTYQGLSLLARPGKKERALALSMLERVELAPYAQRQIGQLSGGQKQRVFLARALAQNPEVYLLDEPLQGVDAQTEGIIVDLLKAESRAGKTVLAVHHNLDTLPRYFDGCILIHRCVVASGPVEEVFTKENIHKTYSCAPETDLGN